MAVECAKENGVAQHDEHSLQRHEPISAPEKIVCVRLNYKEHAEEGDNPLPDKPKLFSKFPTTIIGPDDEIV